MTLWWVVRYLMGVIEERSQLGGNAEINKGDEK
jgi:hypothetical protein